ncbi:MAG: histidinol dehydrogenase [Bacteroidales bacterium]|nr:histidinol dehydrogenase [Bacteroidales bacterium]
MKRYIDPDKSLWQELTARVMVDDAVIEGRVASILERVRKDGDKALIDLASEIDKVDLSAGIEVSQSEIAEAVALVSDELKASVEAAYANIHKFHSAQKFIPVDVNTSPGVRCVQKAVPIQKVGLYIPGGSAPLFSTVLMLAIPAKVAGCREVILCTPCGRDGKVASAVLYAASLCGVDRIFKVGGAQAVAAMAYGTQTVPAVDKIFGPGNRYVTKAKEMVSRKVAIDMPAGPSEVLVMADESAVPSFVASDLLSQAEHGPDSQVILVCDNEDLAYKVQMAVDVQLEALPRKEVALKALSESRMIVIPSIDRQIEFVNMYGPEHLIISMSDPWSIAERITAAGSVFIGNYTPESAGDYASGTNHTLPTSGWARSMSGVNLDSFVRKITYQEITREGISALGSTIVTMAQAEGLDAHANAAIIRIKS